MVMCYDVLPDSRRIVISQPTPGVHKTDIGREVDLTMVSRIRNQAIRIGARAWVHSLQQDYELSGGEEVSVVHLTYEPELSRYNLRSSYRLEPTNTYQVRASLTAPDGTVVPRSEVQVRDISCAGVGLELLKESLDSSVADKLMSGGMITVKLQLLDYEHPKGNENHSLDLERKGEIVRRFSAQGAEILTLGVEFRGMEEPAEQQPIAAFINAAQRHELRERSQM